MDPKDEFKFPDEIEENSVEITTEGDVEVEIVDDTPEKDRGRKPLDKEVEDPTDEEIEGYSDKVQRRIKDLTHARHDERRAKEALLREKQELENFARQMLEENKRLKTTVHEGSQQFVSMAQTAAEAKLEKARREYKAAQESFDSDAILAAQESLFEAKLEADQAKKFKPTPLQTEEFEVQTRHAEPETVRPDEKTLRWQAKNQWFGANGFEEITSFALGLHQKLVTSGVDPRSDEYFEQIDARVKSKFPEVFGEQDKPRNGSSQRKPATVAAPATRSSGPRKVQLTETQRALARKFGLTDQQYALQVVKLENSNG